MNIAIALCALVCFATIGELVLARHSSALEWTQYKREHGKVYGAEEDAKRFSLFLAAKDEIRRHNANPASSHKLGLNHLSDYSHEEFAKLNGFRQNAVEHKLRLATIKHDEFVQSILNDPSPLPAEVDWRKVPNRVSAVKSQGHCGSCWAFATTGLLEGQEVNANKSKMISLSEQDLMDCSDSNYGCGGGIMDSALDDIAHMGGIESEKDYPYKAVEGKCRFIKTKVVMTDKKGVDLPQHEDAIKTFVAKYGPVAIAMYADEMKHYKSGVFSSPFCDEDPDHAVLVVGYGTDPKMGDYWLVKNSWGPKWGEQGYFRIKRGVQMCSIGSFATIAKVN